MQPGHYLLLIDEAGYIPCELEAANLFLPSGLRSLRMRLTGCHQLQPLRPLGEVSGDGVVADAMIDRLVHHAEGVALKGDRLL